MNLNQLRFRAQKHWEGGCGAVRPFARRHPERSRFSGLAKDLPFNRLVTSAKHRPYLAVPSLLRRGTGRLAVFSLLSFPLLGLGNPQAKPDASGTKSTSAVPVSIQHIQILLDQGAPAVEIITTAPVVPQINKSDDAMRLVADFPNTNMSVSEKVVPIKNRDLGALRLNLRNTTPPMVHLEVDFHTPLYYRWDSAGNRLRVTFHEIHKDDVPAAPTASAASPEPSPLPVSAPADVAEFTHLVRDEQLAPGTSITADDDTVVLRLKRAGDVYVCPQTSVSVVQARTGPDVTLAINNGGLETHLALKNSADEVVTPDFRILLRGPGEFHYAIRADTRGNTCVRTLPGNTASAIIYELMGDGKYEAQVRDQVIFRDGKLSVEPTVSRSQSVLPVECGCPPPSRLTLPSAKPEPQIAVGNSSFERAAPVEGRPDSGPTLAENSVGPGAPTQPEAGMEVPELPDSLRQQPHVNVEASLAFSPNPAEIAARHLPASSRQLPSTFTAPLPPSPLPGRAPEEHKTVFGKIKNFFSRVFQ